MGGSILAMVARRLGRRVVLLERGRHPRFAIGESSSPLAGILIEQLAARYDLPRLAPLASYGAWQRHYPQIVCGLKRGFTYFKHEAGRRYATAPDRSNQLLVAASPCDELADTHWLRSDVDAWLVREAVALGAEYIDECQVEGVDCSDTGVRVRASRGGRTVAIDAGGLIDASGPRGCLHRALGLPESGFDGYPATSAFFSHFEHVARCDALDDFRPGACPATDARRRPIPWTTPRVHHVFDGGWMWVLRFGNGVTSAGVAVEDWLAAELRLADGAPAWPRLLARFPSLATAFADATPTRGFDWQPRLAYRTRRDRGPAMGAAAVGRRVRRSAVLDRVSADAARHRAAGPSAGARSVPGRAGGRGAHGLAAYANDHRAPKRIRPRGSWRGATRPSADSTPSPPTRCSTSRPRASPKPAGA